MSPGIIPDFPIVGLAQFEAANVIRAGEEIGDVLAKLEAEDSDRTAASC
jgi:hypothetical protein